MIGKTPRIGLLLLLIALAIAAYAEREGIAPYVPTPVLALLGGGTASAAPEDPGGRHRSAKPVAVTTKAATAGSLPVTFETLGYVRPVASTTMSSQITGRIAAIPVKDGARVKAGDLLVALDDREAQALVAKDEAVILRDRAALDDAQKTLARIGRLVDSGAATTQAGDDAAAAVTEAGATLALDQAALEVDRVALSQTRILAPFDGRIGVVGVSVGALVQPGMAIATVTQTAPVYAEFSLPESALSTVSAAFAAGTLRAAATAPGATGQTDEGAVVFLDNAVDQSSATIRLRALLPNPKLALVSGQSIDVAVTAGRRDGLVLVPGVAIEPREGGSIAYVVASDGTVDLRKVDVALRAGDVVGLSGGLKAGEHVVVEGQIDLAQGTRVLETPAPADNPPGAGTTVASRP